MSYVQGLYLSFREGEEIQGSTGKDFFRRSATFPVKYGGGGEDPIEQPEGLGSSHSPMQKGNRIEEGEKIKEKPLSRRKEEME